MEVFAKSKRNVIYFNVTKWSDEAKKVIVKNYAEKKMNGEHECAGLIQVTQTCTYYTWQVEKCCADICANKQRIAQFDQQVII